MSEQQTILKIDPPLSCGVIKPNGPLEQRVVSAVYYRGG